MTKHKIQLLLDSGVFSAWNRGEQLALSDYISYVKDHQRLLSSCVNMDVIPGVFGRKRTQKEVEDSASGSYRNLQVMKDAGLSPIPVFHQGERFAWLEKMLADGEKYMGISSSKDEQRESQQLWLDEVFHLLTDEKGRPLLRTHGFGISRPSFLLRYPWATTDSTTWSLTPGFGSILVPPYPNYRLGNVGEPDYTKLPVRVIMSGVQQKSSTNQRRQFEGEVLNVLHKEAISDFLKREVGLTITQARYGTTHRRRAVLAYYMALGQHLIGRTFDHRRSNDLLQPRLKTKLTRPKQDWHLTVIFATNLNREWSDLMNSIGANNRLLSYYELKGKPEGTVEEYVTKGIVNGDYTGRRQPKADWGSESYRNYRRLALARKSGEQNADDAK